MPRSDRRRGRRDPYRDLPGHVADQGSGERRQDRPSRGGGEYPDFRPGHGGNHRHAAGRTGYRRRRDGDRQPGRAVDGAELRHRSAGNGGACRLARRELARPDLGAAQRRPAGIGGRANALPPERRRPRELAGALRGRGRCQSDRRMLRYIHSAHPGAGCDAAQTVEIPPRPGGAQAGVGSVGCQLVSGRAAAAGKRHLRHRRALQCQRFEEVARAAGKARLGRLRVHGPRAGRRRLARVGHLHRLCRPRRELRDDRGHSSLHRIREHTAGDRFHRNAGYRRRAEAAWR